MRWLKRVCLELFCIITCSAQAHANGDVLRMTLSCGLRVVIVRDDPLTHGVMLYGDSGQPTPPPNVNLCVGASNAGFKDLLIETLTTGG